MIRLPASSISLSEHDIQLHMQDINAYHGLLAQGFKKQDIIRYYAEQRASVLGMAISPQVAPGDLETKNLIERIPLPDTNPNILGGNAPTCVELRSSAPTESPFPHTKHETNEHSTGHVEVPEMSGAIAELPTSPHFQNSESCQTGASNYKNVLSGGGHPLISGSPRDAGDSPQLLSQVNIQSRHAPRQSSLLRYTKNVSPETSQHSDGSSGTTDPELYHTSLENPHFLTSPRTRARCYRPRSRTYPFMDSDADDSGQTPTSIQSIESEFSALTLESGSPSTALSANPVVATTTTILPHTRIIELPVGAALPATSPLRPEAEEFIPFRLPPPFSATHRTSPSQYSFSSSVRNVAPASTGVIPEGPSSNFSPVTTPPRRSSLSATTRYNASQASSPTGDYLFRPPQSSDGRVLRQDFSPPGPATPRVHNVRQSTAEPYNSSRQQYDGSSFLVYDDKVPARHQPQTPADLSRSRLITEREVAYIAPPGMVNRNTFTASRHRHGTSVLEPGEQSPTVRAMDIRQRRNREIMRSFRVEGSRWARMRGFDTGGDEFWRAHTNDLESSLGDAWRDDLDADRIGEENFEDHTSVRRRARIFEDGR